MNSKYIKIISIAAIAIVVILAIIFREPLKDSLISLNQWINENKLLGSFLFVLIYTIAPIFFLPVNIFSVSAGWSFGIFYGVLLVSLAATLSCVVTFLMGRFIFRDWLEKKAEENKKIKAVKKAVNDKGWKIVALSRFSPILPFSILNYSYGASDIPFWQFTLASALAMIPGTCVYVYGGTLIKNLGDYGSSENGMSVPQMTLFGFGIVATIVLIIYLTKQAKEALSEYE